MKKKITKTIISCLFLMGVSTNVSFASGAIATTSARVEDSMTVHQWAHFGAGYIINDQLKKYTKLTPLERVLATAFCGYAKEKWIDKDFSKKECLATAAGALFVEVKF